MRGIGTYKRAQEIVRRARESSGLNSDEALELAVKETKQYRQEKRD